VRFGPTDHDVVAKTELEPFAVDHQVRAWTRNAFGFELARERRQTRVIRALASEPERLTASARRDQIANALQDLLALAFVAHAPLLDVQHLLELLHGSGVNQRPCLALGIAGKRVDLGGEGMFFELLELKPQGPELTCTELHLPVAGEIELQARTADHERPSGLGTREPDRLCKELQALFRIGRCLHTEHTEPRCLLALASLDVEKRRLLEPSEGLLATSASALAKSEAPEYAQGPKNSQRKQS
jgi:hypothetical protein